jgi:hypothetical protein
MLDNLPLPLVLAAGLIRSHVTERVRLGTLAIWMG